MALNIEVEWHRPIPLTDGGELGLVYWCELDLLPQAPGVYVFGRNWGGSFTPLYIGQATRLRARVKQQLHGNVRLMMGVQNNVRAGQRELRYCTISRKPGQQVAKVLNVLERSLIEAAIVDGFELINVSGTIMRYHTITSVGRKKHHHPFPRELRVEARGR